MQSVEAYVRALLACVFALLIPISGHTETCNGGQDNAGNYLLIQDPGTLQPGVPAHVKVRVTNTGPTTWFGESNSIPFRLGARPGNQLLWSNFACNGYNRGITDERAFLCSAVAPNSTTDFDFDATVPNGTVGSANLNIQMVYDAGTACDGWFGPSVSHSFPVASGPSCSNTELGVSNDQWRLQVWSNRNFSGSTVEQRYTAPNASGGFQFDWGAGVSTCAGQTEYSTKLTRNVFLDVGHYTFNVHGDDGVRLIVGGAMLVNEWRDPQFADFTATLDITTAGFYTVELQHYQASGGSSVGLSWHKDNVNTPPAAPSGLTATGGNARVDLSWAGVSGATSYNIKRSTTSGSGYQTVGTSAITSFGDTSVTNGITYYYVITAVNANGESQPSAQASARPDAGTPSCPNAALSVPANGWLLEIYNNRDLAGEPVERRYDAGGEGGFNFNWTGGKPSDCVGFGDYSVRFKRMANFAQSGSYRFNYTTDDGMRAWVDGTQIINRWQDQAISDSTIASVSAGSHLLEVQYYQGQGNAQATLSWAFDGGGTSVPDAPTGLRATAGNSVVSLIWNTAGNVSVYHVKRSTTDVCCFNEIGQTAGGSFNDTNVTNNTTYYYVVSGSNSAGEGSDSAPVTATPVAPPVGQPDLKIEIVSSLGAVLASGSSLTLNTDGWPTPNPLQLKVTLSCPADRAQGCDDSLTMLLESTNGLARMYSTPDQAKCVLAPGLSDPHYASMRWQCYDGVVGAGQSRTFVFPLVVQPSAASTLSISASWGSLKSAQSQLGIPLAKIHPLIVLPGILGTMPPWPHVGEFDPVLAVYEPLMTQLGKLGYDGFTLFRMPYDWRRSNRITARYLRDRIQEALAESRSVPWIDPDGKVDLLVHSMGGLVTRSYVEGEGLEANGQGIPYNNDIRKVVFVATPHRGFPETYKTYETGSWWDYLYDTWGPWQAMDKVFWPAFVFKHWRESYPTSVPPIDCDWSVTVVTCFMNEYVMTHDPVGGIESLREMLPTEDADQFFGPYLCDIFNGSVCTGPYKYGKQFNPLLNRLNTNVGLLDARLGSSNIYVIYGTDPNPNNRTDVVYDVKAPPSGTFLGGNGWANGEMEQNYVTAAGDDLIPEYSLNLKLLLPSIPAQNVAKLAGEKGRHKQIMYSPNLLSIYAPQFLAGMSPVPFTTEYAMPLFLIEPYQWWVLAGLCPVNLTITDAHGRRLGYDPATGGTLNEIPGMYAAKNSENQVIILKNPLPGTYTITVSAFGDGPFSLGLHQLSQTGSPRRWGVEGNVSAGQTFQYTVNIDPQLPIDQHNPIANAGPDQTIAAGDACTAEAQLDGSASSDPDGEALTFHWSGPFGYASGPRPLVRLPVGNHEIRLMVLDGQKGGSGARTHVRVTAKSPEVKSLTATPSVLQPADNTMRDVTVTADVTSVCGATPTCRIVAVDSDEGDKHDWQIVSASKVKVRAARSGDGNGRVYSLRIECSIPNGETLRKTVTVKVPPPGRMKGAGSILHDGLRYQFDFDVSESKGGKDAGSVKLSVQSIGFDADDDDDDRKTDGHKPSKCRSSGALSVVFRDDDDFNPGQHAKVDVAKVKGAGEWNGKAGYTFEMKAIDDGEPGHGRDRFKIVIRDSKGNSVARVDEEIDSGNIQSLKPPK